MSYVNPKIREGLSRLVLKSFGVTAVAIFLWQGQYLNLILPADLLSWVWVCVMTGFFLSSGLIFMIPYQIKVDREVRAFQNVEKHLNTTDRQAYASLLNGGVFNSDTRKSAIAELFSYIKRQSKVSSDIRQKVDTQNLLVYMANSHALASRPLMWHKRNLLTYGIIGTYVGIRMATAGAEGMASGEDEAIFAFVIEMFMFLGLAILTTLAGVILGSVLLNNPLERAERTVQTIINKLSVELPTSGFVGWVDAGKPMNEPAPKEEA